MKTNDEQPKCYRTKKEAVTPYYKTKKKQTTLNNPSHNMTKNQKKKK
jgi:hypothetical protein